METGRLGSAKRIVIIDTNTLLYMAQGLIPPSTLLEEAYYPRLATTSRVIEELNYIIGKGRPLDAKRARTALGLIERLGVEVLPWDGEGDADDSIEWVATTLKHAGHRVMVATSDRELRERLRMKGIPTIYYRRSRGGVEVEWDTP
ncbi:MAG: 30S processome protein Utp24 [Desulfurococcales archaeon]|nr:30S processome protein Utp24 [Desulfurococcales archaeon]